MDSSSKTTKRISLTIQDDVLSDVDALCSALGVSRSSLISEFLRPTVSQVKHFIDSVMPDVEAGVAERNPTKIRSILHSVLSEQTGKAHVQISEAFNDDTFKH